MYEVKRFRNQKQCYQQLLLPQKISASSGPLLQVGERARIKMDERKVTQNGTKASGVGPSLRLSAKRRRTHLLPSPTTTLQTPSYSYTGRLRVRVPVELVVHLYCTTAFLFGIIMGDCRLVVAHWTSYQLKLCRDGTLGSHAFAHVATLPPHPRLTHQRRSYHFSFSSCSLYQSHIVRCTCYQWKKKTYKFPCYPFFQFFFYIYIFPAFDHDNFLKLFYYKFFFYYERYYRHFIIW